MKYAFIKANTPQFSVTALCRNMNVARSGYYDWRKRPETAKGTASRNLDAEIRIEFERKKQREGSPRLTLALRERGISVSENTVANRMKNMELRAKAKKKFKATTNSAHDLPVATNLLKREFSVAKPNTVWVTDITYLRCDEGWMYLAVMIDLYSRKVVGWSIGSRMTAQLVCDALKMARFKRKRPTGVIVHSDRGSQYCGGDFQSLLKEYKMYSSMSRKGDCWDNAVAESFFHSLKVEAIHGERVETRFAMREVVFEYIEIYYNRERRHSTNGYQTPEQFEQRKAA